MQIAAKADKTAERGDHFRPSPKLVPRLPAVAGRAALCLSRLASVLTLKTERTIASRPAYRWPGSAKHIKTVINSFSLRFDLKANFIVGTKYAPDDKESYSIKTSEGMSAEMEQTEEIIMQIIVNSGEARSLCLNALKLARQRQFEEAEELLFQAKERLSAAHSVQTTLIQDEIRGETVPISLIMIHAQDHLMNAQTVRDLVTEMIMITKLN
ncbi:PTS lactose/cellobiose transporter subunit IIA [Kalamiella sp. sgz302252]|uniref:PTS lactose/cellobiose transporter subunit IIA n=1 Tax=Pantoea sp. sgz302252 TaxID=3341827 RepID=UPI0036D24DC0